MSYKIVIENSGEKVSPGGELKFNVSNANQETGWGVYFLFFELDDDALVEKYSARQISWDYQKNLSHPRHAKITLKDRIQGRLPKTAKIIAYKDEEKTQKVAEKSFTIVQGSFGKNPYKDKYVIDITADPSHKDGQHAWYRISCMGAPGEVCNINIKDGEHDKYDGQQPRISHHGISEKNYPGTSKLRVGEPIIFDARQLIVENNAEPTPPAGYKLEMNAVCRISSDKPIMVEPINNDHIGKKV